MTQSRLQKQKFLMLLPVLSVIAISGCTTLLPGTGGGGPGVNILAFQPELVQVNSQEPVKFLVQIQNGGESRARNVRAELFNIDLEEWGGFGFGEQQLGDLVPFDIETQTPGEVKQTTFGNLRAPRLPKGQEFDYSPRVRVSYDYITTAQKPITIVDRNELVRLQQTGNSLPAQSTRTSQGPLQVDIVTGNFVKTSGTGAFAGRVFDIFPVQIRITNTQFGTGTVVPKTAFGSGGGFLFGDEDYPVDVRITPPAGTNFVFSGGGSYFHDCTSSQFRVGLFRGQETSITCELEVTKPPSVQTESLIQVELDYRFAIDAATNIKVIGTDELGGPFF